LRLVRGGLMANAAAMGHRIMERIADWPAKFPIVGDVRGRGLMVAIDLVKDKQSKLPAHAEREALVEQAFQRGLLLLGCGEGAIRLMPALTVGPEDVDYALGVIEELIEQL